MGRSMAAADVAARGRRRGRGADSGYMAASRSSAPHAGAPFHRRGLLGRSSAGPPAQLSRTPGLLRAVLPSGRSSLRGRVVRCAPMLTTLERSSPAFERAATGPPASTRTRSMDGASLQASQAEPTCRSARRHTPPPSGATRAALVAWFGLAAILGGCQSPPPAPCTAEALTATCDYGGYGTTCPAPCTESTCTFDVRVSWQGRYCCGSATEAFTDCVCEAGVALCRLSSDARERELPRTTCHPCPDAGHAD